MKMLVVMLCLHGELGAQQNSTITYHLGGQLSDFRILLITAEMTKVSHRCDVDRCS